MPLKLMISCHDMYFLIPTHRAMRGKNKATFLNKLKGVITTFCDMIKHECPEGELVAPKYVSYPSVCVYVLTKCTLL